MILATAVTEKGFVGSDSTEVILDTEPPKIAISYPPEGLVTNETVVPDLTVVDDLDSILASCNLFFRNV